MKNRNHSKLSIIGPVCLLAWFWLSSATLRADENLFPDGGFELGDLYSQWAPPHRLEQTMEEANSGNAALHILGGMWHVAAEPMAIDPEKTYVLGAFFKEPAQKRTDDYQMPTVFFGLRLLDEMGETISPYAVRPVPGTETVLARAAAAGDTVLYLEGVPWEGAFQSVPTAVALDAMDDLSDLPNQRAVPIAKVVAAAAGFEVHLGEPLTADYPAGASVREHRYADFPQISFQPSGNWDEHTLEIGGLSEPGVVERGRFWHGTRFVKITLGASIPGGGGLSAEGIEFLVDDLSLVAQP